MLAAVGVILEVEKYVEQTTKIPTLFVVGVVVVVVLPLQ